MSAIQSAVAAVGGQTALAKIILVSPQAVNQWVARGSVSHTKVLAVEKASGVSRNLLRPDLYPGAAEVPQ
jgi:DNA-binding transcriptional regulator YdaS (Cro superfamily)